MYFPVAPESSFLNLITALSAAVTHQSLTIARNIVLCKVGRRDESTVGQLLFSEDFPVLSGSYRSCFDDIIKHPLRWPSCRKVTGAFLVPGSTEGAEFWMGWDLEGIGQGPYYFWNSFRESSSGHGRGRDCNLVYWDIYQNSEIFAGLWVCLLVVKIWVCGSLGSCFNLGFSGLVWVSAKGSWRMTFLGRNSIRWKKATELVYFL